MSRLLKIMRTILGLSSRLALGSSPLIEPVRNTSDEQSHKRPFLDLPPEILLTISACLEMEWQVLLSLTCRHLRNLVAHERSTHLDKPAKLQVLRYLEHDYPEYLACHSCAVLFRWPGRRLIAYRCTRYLSHPWADISTSLAFFMPGEPNTSVTRETVKLI